MGCDIHLIVQARVTEALLVDEAPATAGLASEWRFIAPPENMREYRSLLWDLGRSYTLFAPLAGVRDNSDQGVMDSVRHRRGLPDDITRAAPGYDDGNILTLHGLVWLGDHSYTHFTVEEMLADPVWDQFVTERGDRGTWRDLNRWWFDNVVPALLAIGPPDRVRLVMGFDS